ncbi:mitochondrial import receptor subunit TOM20 homolog [Gopherus flavomarginatus]|uniref:mitochondrial import receptor subunit TOM20 homolog n=1 Tax=Gopherus flavomarginatus TaxID=286002 RepID=UPI0021CBCED4|nr:mitochondrial import receptor subunit TOM20 homolog [Gopherus flavomarginatus]
MMRPFVAPKDLNSGLADERYSMRTVPPWCEWITLPLFNKDPITDLEGMHRLFQGKGLERASSFIGYCIYFDRKRRSDPNFKNRLRERRKKQKLAKERAGLSKLPDLKDAEAVQKFFLEEIQLGEELLAQGDYEKGVDHLTNAIAVCGQPQQLLQVLQQTLPPPVFQMLLTKLPTISQRIVNAQCLAEDDVE